MVGGGGGGGFLLLLQKEKKKKKKKKKSRSSGEPEWWPADAMASSTTLTRRIIPADISPTILLRNSRRNSSGFHSFIVEDDAGRMLNASPPLPDVRARTDGSYDSREL